MEAAREMENLLSASLSQEQEISRELQRRVRELQVRHTWPNDWISDVDISFLQRATIASPVFLACLLLYTSSTKCI